MIADGAFAAAVIAGEYIHHGGELIHDEPLDFQSARSHRLHIL